MQIPDEIAETVMTLNERYFDLKGLSKYASLSVSNLNYHIRENGLPCYRVRNAKGRIGKRLILKSEFDSWMIKRWKQDQNIEAMADEAIESLKSDL